MEGKDGIKRLKRNRIAYSCLACRDRKTRCDRARPCNQCVMRNEVHRCTFADTPSRPSHRGTVAKTVAGEVSDRLRGEGHHSVGNSPDADIVVAGLQQRLARMETLFTELSNGSTSPSSQQLVAEHRNGHGKIALAAVQSDKAMLELCCASLPSSPAMDLLLTS